MTPAGSKHFDKQSGNLETWKSHAQEKSTTCKNWSESRVSALRSDSEFVPTDALSADAIWDLAQNTDGCRQLQTALDSGTLHEKATILDGLRGHIGQAIQCPNANHVLQKCIYALEPSHFAFIIEEIIKSDAIAIAKHKFGCRVIKRLIEYCTEEQSIRLIDVLAEGISTMAVHPYGSSVVPHMLMYCGDLQYSGLSQMIVDKVHILARDPHSCVALSALVTSRRSDAHLSSLFQAILAEPGLVVSMARFRRGRPVVQEMLQLLEGAELQALKHELVFGSGDLCASRHGRAIASCLGPTTSGRANIREIIAVHQAGG